MGTPDMYPYVVPYLPDSSWGHERYFLVASLFAVHPAESRRGISFGSVFRKIWEDSGKSDSIMKRFEALLSADSEDIGGYLRHAISLAKSRNVAIDYHQLFYDLGYWDHPDRFVQRAWAKDFWGYKMQKTIDS
jgi:CRISPR system Cascade subunit CasB